MVQCNRKELLQAVQILSGILPHKTPKPVLENILFRFQNKVLELIATDLEIGIKITLSNVTFEDENDFLLPGSKLLGILKESESEQIDLKMDQTFCKVTSGDDSYKVFSLSPSEYPQWTPFPEKETFSISSSRLKEMLAKTSFAASKEATRYTMNSVLFDIKSKIFKAVATDGKRLSIMTTETNIEGEHFLLVPLKGIHQIEKILLDKEEEVQIFIENNQLLMKTNQYVLTVHLLQGNYPPYDNVVPKGFPVEAVLDKTTLLKSLKKSILLTTQDSKSVRLFLSKKSLTLFSNDPNIGESTIVAPLKKEIAEDLEISFNPNLIMEVLKVLKGDEVILEMKNATSPCIIREGSHYLYVVMPLNI